MNIFEVSCGRYSGVNSALVFVWTKHEGPLRNALIGFSYLFDPSLFFVLTLRLADHDYRSQLVPIQRKPVLPFAPPRAAAWYASAAEFAACGVRLRRCFCVQRVPQCKRDGQIKIHSLDNRMFHCFKRSKRGLLLVQFIGVLAFEAVHKPHCHN